MGLVPWHRADRNAQSTGSSRRTVALSYTSVLPDLRRVADSRREELRTKVAARNGEHAAWTSSTDGGQQAAEATSSFSEVQQSNAFAVRPPRRPRSEAGPVRRGVPMLLAHDNQRMPGPVLLMLQREQPDTTASNDHIWHGSFASEAQLSEVMNSFAASHLARLRLGDNRQLSPHALAGAAPKLPRLRELCLRGTRATDEVVAAFVGACAELSVLDISDCDDLMNVGSLSSLTDFRELKASKCVKAITPDFIASLQTSKKLEVLELAFCPGVTTEALMELAVGCKSLAHLDLAGCKHVGDAGCVQLSYRTPQALSRYCEWIEEISMSRIASLKDQQLRQLLQGCPRLEHLDLTGCQSLTQQGLLDVIPIAPNLQKLSLSMVSDLTDHGMALLQNLLLVRTALKHVGGPQRPQALPWRPNSGSQKQAEERESAEG
mmetsp:Transcript_125303/g.400509  ORF Transcript_125303/g.400509 Transcript_125303/m.400509 type:complete len:434 (+) Transcript_125303:96-1397(+)